MKQIVLTLKNILILCQEQGQGMTLQLPQLRHVIQHTMTTIFFNRVARTWNLISYDNRDEMVNLESITPAKKILKQFLSEQFLEKFQSYLKCTWFVKCTCTNCKIT